MLRHPATPSARPTMTRREWLMRLGMIGGSGMVLGVMDAWQLLAAPAGPRPELRGQQPRTRVVILGGGISGLVTGYELGKLGYDTTILEASDRTGGLIWTVRRGTSHTEIGEGGERQTCEFDEGQFIDVGAWRIPHDHEGLIGYCRELGIRLEEFNDENLLLYNENPAIGPLGRRKIELRELRSDLWGHVSELLAKAVDQGALDTQLTADDRERLLQFLVRAGYLDGPDRVYRPDLRMRGSVERYDLSALLQSPFINQVRSLTANTGGPRPVFHPTGGMDQIPRALERAVHDRITYRAEVVSVRQTENQARVVYRDTRSGESTELVADFVVCCLPMSILKALDINFSPAMREVVDASGHAAQAKLGLQMGRRFWEEDEAIFGGHLVYNGFDANGGQNGGGASTNPLPQFSYPSSDYGSRKGVLLGFYGNSNTPGLDGRPLSQSPVRARIEHVLTHASRVHPQVRESFESAYAVWWERVEYARGAWASSPGARLEQLSRPDGRLYIGSAAASPDPAWMEGAIEAAWRAVRGIHERVMSGA